MTVLKKKNRQQQKTSLLCTYERVFPVGRLKAFRAEIEDRDYDLSLHYVDAKQRPRELN
jgi:hypothetical protein